MNLLIVDDEPSMRELLTIVFTEERFKVRSAGCLDEAWECVESWNPDVVLCDLRLGTESGLDLLQKIRQKKTEIAFILVTAYASSQTAIDALKFGAFDYVTKPFDMDELKRIVREAIGKSLRSREEEQSASSEKEEAPRIVGLSPAMLKIYKTIGVVAPTGSTVLITGESGTGKEMIARVIHDASPRKMRPFVSVNCGAFPETLLESELFGYQKGAFTGAVTAKRGLFEAAHEGTLFLDEIAETTKTMQVKLLRALQERTIRRLGGTEETPVNVRIIAATNKDLHSLIDSGEFREDLYFRLAVIPIHLPPLRERREDIPALAQYFLDRYSLRMKKDVRDISPEAMERLVRAEWRGNVRELENAVERAVALETTEVLQAERFHQLDMAPSRDSAIRIPLPSMPTEGLDLDAILEDLERRMIQQALEASGGVQVDAAHRLHITYRSLRHRIQKLGIDVL